MKKIFLLIAVLLILITAAACGAKELPSAPDESIESETDIQETESEAVEPEPPVDEATVRAALAKELEIDISELTLADASYSAYSDESYTFYYEYTDSESYAPITAIMKVNVLYTLDSASGEWIYHSWTRSLGSMVNIDYLLGEWEDEDGCYLNVKDISDSHISYDYRFDGEEGTGEARVTQSIGSLGSWYSGIQLTLISPAGCEYMVFYAEESDPDYAYWCVDNQHIFSPLGK